MFEMIKKNNELQSSFVTNFQIHLKESPFFPFECVKISIVPHNEVIRHCNKRKSYCSCVDTINMTSDQR